MPIKPIYDEFIIAGEMTLHYVQWGAEGKPVVCVHGLTANAFCFQALADALAPDHRIFSYDLRGRGDSDRPEDDYSIPTHAMDLLELLDGLGLEKPVIVGHSLGASIALYFAAHYPDRLSKLVLIDGGAPLPWKRPDEAPQWLISSIARLGTPAPSYKAYVAQLQALPFLGPYWNEYAEIYIKNDVRPEGDGSVVAKAEVQAIIEEGKRFQEGLPEEQWAKVRVPTLLLRAGQKLMNEGDQILSAAMAEQAQQHIPDCQLVSYPNLNHYTILFAIEPGPMQELRQFID